MTVADVCRPVAVRDLNDAFRRTFVGGKVMLTAGVAALPEADRDRLLSLVRSYASFDPGNDPHDEHDFGAIEYCGERFFWKIDCYDTDLLHASPDPANPAVTCRVLTIMWADEY
ncbi:DUF3768 domain-containing protein [Neoaquamicrobium sediminum]|uniref:DUF3768 domain-containing protein n=1 Tax=Neoaquamicrobium sediminum TaxID=1849104 RepID=UPI003BABDF29